MHNTLAMKGVYASVCVRLPSTIGRDQFLLWWLSEQCKDIVYSVNHEQGQSFTWSDCNGNAVIMVVLNKILFIGLYYVTISLCGHGTEHATGSTTVYTNFKMSFEISVLEQGTNIENK